MIVAAVFTRRVGTPRLGPRGHWWITRRQTALESDGTLTVEIADGERVARVNGTPEMLTRLSESIVAQVQSAIANTTPGGSENGGK